MRIAGIDAPETHPPRCAHEARLRRQATEQLQALLNSGALTMTRIDRDRDSYGRRGVVRLSRRAGTRIAGGAFVPFATPGRIPTMSEREKIEPHEGDVRYQRRKEDGTFGESDDQEDSLRQDIQQHAEHEKPRNEGDKGD